MPILTVGISYYGIDNVPTEKPQTIQWIDEVEKKLAGRRILLVDEVDDTRVTLEYTPQRAPEAQPAGDRGDGAPQQDKAKRGQYPAWVQHVFEGESLDDHWIVYPWDATDIAEHERLAASTPTAAGSRA